MSFEWPWNRKKYVPKPSAPGVWEDRSQFFDYSRPKNTINDTTDSPLVKTVDSIPSGERREVFDLTTVNAQDFDIFRNPESIPVEVNEIFILATVNTNVSIKMDGQKITPLLPLLANQFYSDSGFALPPGALVSLSIDTLGGSVVGYLRWRYV